MFTAGWALYEVIQSWRALVIVPRSAHTEVLMGILVGNLYQQVARLVMEGLCLTAGIVTAVMPASEQRPRSPAMVVVTWLLVGFRVTLVSNSVLELWSQRQQRARMSR